MDWERCRCLLFLLAGLGCGRTPLDGGGQTHGGAADSGEDSTENSGAWGSSCTSDQDCRPDSMCCDGSTPSCDVTRLPTGDTINPGELAYAFDDTIATDTVTGLMWQLNALPQCPGDSSGACTWSEGSARCASLTLGGLSGWRLPGRMELLTLADYLTPAGDAFWTSSLAAGSPGRAWYASFGAGGSSVSPVAEPMAVRCVRGARCVPKVRFAVLDDGLVQDKLTGLVWQQVAHPTAMSWEAAESHCSSLGSGFRLPTIKELASLVDLTVAAPGPSIDTTAFPNTPEAAGAFWSSTPYGVSPGAAWQVYFGIGGTGTADHGNRLRVRCVSK